MDRAALTEQIRRNPWAMTLQLAQQFQVPEVEVLRAFPDGRATELDAGRWREVCTRLSELEAVFCVVSNRATTVEVSGRFAGFSETGPFFNVRSDTLDLHLRPANLAAMLAVEKPAHQNGQMSLSVQWFDPEGAAALKVFLNFGTPATPAQREWFVRLRRDLARPTGPLDSKPPVPRD